jgi:hypothetical protein
MNEERLADFANWRNRPALPWDHFLVLDTGSSPYLTSWPGNFTSERFSHPERSLNDMMFFPNRNAALQFIDSLMVERPLPGPYQVKTFLGWVQEQYETLLEEMKMLDPVFADQLLIAQEGSLDERVELAAQDDIDYVVQQLLVQDASVAVRSALGRNAAIYPDTQITLLHDRSVDVRMALFANENLEPQIAKELGNDMFLRMAMSQSLHSCLEDQETFAGLHTYFQHYRTPARSDSASVACSL